MRPRMWNEGQNAWEINKTKVEFFPHRLEIFQNHLKFIAHPLEFIRDRYKSVRDCLEFIPNHLKIILRIYPGALGIYSAQILKIPGTIPD